MNETRCDLELDRLTQHDVNIRNIINHIILYFDIISIKVRWYEVDTYCLGVASLKYGPVSILSTDFSLFGALTVRWDNNVCIIGQTKHQAQVSNTNLVSSQYCNKKLFTWNVLSMYFYCKYTNKSSKQTYLPVYD